MNKQVMSNASERGNDDELELIMFWGIKKNYLMSVAVKK